jgi:hypothetical protein
MNLACTIELFCCNPAAGTCGRKPLAGRTVFQGMPISIEYKAGQYRSGVSPDGTKWKKMFQYPYGYFLHTDAPDGDHLDVMIGPNKNSPNVFIFHQNKPDGSFDEDKCYIGFNDAASARQAFNYQTTGMKWDAFGGMETMTVEQFKPIMRSTFKNPRKLVAPVN